MAFQFTCTYIRYFNLKNRKHKFKVTTVIKIKHATQLYF